MNKVLLRSSLKWFVGQVTCMVCYTTNCHLIETLQGGECDCNDFSNYKLSSRKRTLVVFHFIKCERCALHSPASCPKYKQHL